MTVELLACPSPWCEASERDGDYSPAVRLHHFGNYRVVCTSCMTEGPLRLTQDEAIAIWNTRSSLEGVAGLVEALHRARSSFWVGRADRMGKDECLDETWEAVKVADDTAVATFRQGGR